MAATITEPQVSEVTATDSPGFAGVLAVWRATDAELAPDDPPIPAEELTADLFQPPPDRRRRVWLATLDGVPAGLTLAEQHLDGVNEATFELYLVTDPAHRRRGVARSLARACLTAIAADGGTSVLGWASNPAGAAFSRALGLTTARMNAAAGCKSPRSTMPSSGGGSTTPPAAPPATGWSAGSACARTSGPGR
jgi:GNAT superfamily N-acetyltransferase